MTVLVTGAAGFVGAAIVRRLLAGGGESVRALVRSTSDRRNLAGLEVEPVVGDVTDMASVRAAAKGCRTVFHAAADYRIWARDQAPMFRTNVEGTRNVLLAAAEAGASRIVYTSSVATLGIVPGGRGDEAAPVEYRDMVGAYKQSKFRAEEEARRLAVGEGVPVVIVNPSTPIGPGDSKPTPTGRMVVEAACGRMPAYVDTGLNVVHVDDVAHGHLLACENGTVGERYVLGGDDMTLREILVEVAALRRHRPPRVRLPHGVVLPIAYVAETWARLTGAEPFATVDGVRMARKKMFFSSAKAERALGYRHRPGREALADAVSWYEDHGYLH